MDKVLTKKFKRSYRTSPQGFCISINVYESFTFSTLGSKSPVWQCILGKCTFIIYNSASRERNNSQQLSKLIEPKFISALAYSYK